jgi:hypothetical protein
MQGTPMRNLIVAVVIAAVTLGTQVAGATPPELRARSIHRGIEEPGVYGPANLFDGKPETSYCAAAGQEGRVKVSLSPADAALVGTLRTVRLSPGRADTAARKVTLHVPYRTLGKPAVGNAEATVTDRDVDVAYAQPAQGTPHYLEIVLAGADGKKRRSPLCLGEIVLLGPKGPLVLPGVMAAAEQNAARARTLAALAGKQPAFAKAYLVQHRWNRGNPDKKRSTWEGASYRFLEDGTFSRVTHHVTGAETRQGKFTVAGNGRVVTLEGDDRKKLTLAPCGPFNAGYLCLDKQWFKPAPAQ